MPPVDRLHDRPYSRRPREGRGACSTCLVLIQLFANPHLDIVAPISDVPTDPESRWTFAPVPPLVEGPDGNTEVLSQFCNRQQPFIHRHGPTLRLHPFGRRSDRLSDVPSAADWARSTRASVARATRLRRRDKVTSGPKSPTPQVCTRLSRFGVAAMCSSFPEPFRKGLGN